MRSALSLFRCVYEFRMNAKKISHSMKAHTHTHTHSEWTNAFEKEMRSLLVVEINAVIEVIALHFPSSNKQICPFGMLFVRLLLSLLAIVVVTLAAGLLQANRSNKPHTEMPSILTITDRPTKT